MEPVLEKVRKLLALASNQAATEGERDNAMRQAHKLLAKHNLAMADFDKHVLQEGRTQENLQTFGMHWCRRTGKYIGELFFCRYFYGDKVNGTKLNHYFVGRESNAVTAALMTEYVIASILKEARSKYKQNLSPESRAFAVGAVDALQAKIWEMKKTVEVEEATGQNALVLADYYKTEQQANDDWLNSQGTALVVTKGRSQEVKDARAYNAGREYGKSINLNSQVASRDALQIGHNS